MVDCSPGLLSDDARLPTRSNCRDKAGLVSKQTTPTVSRPGSLGVSIQHRVSVGRCTTAGDVVNTIRLLRDREQTREEVLAQIREQIEVGARQTDADQLRDGRVVFGGIRRRRETA